MCILKLYIRVQLVGVTKLNISALILNNTFNNLYDESPYTCLDLVQPSPKINLFLLIYDPFPTERFSSETEITERLRPPHPPSTYNLSSPLLSFGISFLPVSDGLHLKSLLVVYS